MNERDEGEEVKIVELPIDVLLEILGFIVDFETFMNISRSCKSFYTLCKVNRFWKVILPSIKDSLEHYVNGKINNYHFFKRINLKVSSGMHEVKDMEATIYNQYCRLLKDCERISKLVTKEITRRKKVEIFNQKYKTKLLWRVIQHSSLFVSLFLFQISFVFTALTLDFPEFEKVFEVVNFTTFVMIFLIFSFLQFYDIFINRKYPFPLSRIDIRSCISRKERKKVKKFIVTHENRSDVESPQSKKKRKKKEFLLKWKKRFTPQWKKRVNQHYESILYDGGKRKKKRDRRNNSKIFYLISASQGYLGNEAAHQYIWETEWVREKNESTLCSILCYFNWVFYMLLLFGLKIFITSEYFMWSIVSVPAQLYLTIYTFCLFWLLQKNIRKKTSKLLVLSCLVAVSLSLSLLLLLISLKLDFFGDFVPWSVVLNVPVTFLMGSIITTPCVFCFRFMCHRKKTMAYREKIMFNVLIIAVVMIAALFLESFTILFGLCLDQVRRISFFIAFIPMFLFVMIIHAFSVYSLYYSIRAFADKSTDDFIQSL